MSTELREYQVKITQDTRQKMLDGFRSILIQSPTGSGKTLLTAHMLRTAAQKGMRSIFLVHRRELVKQSVRAFAQMRVPFGVIASGFMEDPKALVQIASVQTVVRRLDKIPFPSLIVYDEAHHCAAGSWAKIHEKFKKSFHIGLTATPERLDGTGLGRWFRTMLNGPSVSWLIENGFLAPYKLYAPKGINVTDVHTRMSDFSKSELSAAADKPTITGDAIKHYLKFGAGKRAVVFCVSIEHSKHVVSQFQGAGIAAAHVDGETDILVRDETIRRFERGDIKVLSNVELFGEGFDLPALEVAILLRPTQSLGLYLQQVGRALRPHPGKSHAIILDHAGNCERHGLPDEERSWSLHGRRDGRKSQSNSSELVKICPKCFAANFPGRPECGFCKFVFELKPREVEQKEGELMEVDLERIRMQRKAEQGKAATLEQLIEIGRKRGYKRPELWAKHILNARQAKKLTGAM